MRPTLLALILFTLLPAAGAREQAAHAHGAARLEIVWVEAELGLRLEGPAFSFLGFERAPATGGERAALQRAQAELADGLALYGLPAAAGCEADVAELELPLPAEASAGTGQAAEHRHAHALANEAGAVGAADAGAHSEWRISHRFNCGKPEALVRIAPALFERFEALQRIDYQLITDTRQDGGRLQRGAPALIELRP